MPDAHIPPRPFTRIEWPTLAFVVVLYLVLVGHYRTFNIDNPWYGAFTYSWWNAHQPYDLLMQRRFPHGMGGVEAFGKLAAAVQGTVMDVAGWRVRNFELLSTTFVAAALFFLADFARRMGRSAHFVVAYLAVAGLTEPFVAAAEQARYEFLTLLLFAVALWCGSQRHVVLSAFFAALCMEIQPSACVVFAAVVVFLLMDRTVLDGRRLPRIALGTVCALPVYLLLHPHSAATFQHADWKQAANHALMPGGFMVGYFADSWRHLVDLAVLLAAVAVGVRSRRHLLTQWPAVALGAAVVLSTAMRWDNARYFALVMPVLAWFVVDAFTEARWRWIAAAVLALYLPQYAWRAVVAMRHPDFTSAEQQRISDAVDRVALGMGRQPAEVRVLGNTAVWFAHPRNFVALDLRTIGRGQPIDTDIVLCFDTKLEPVLKEHSSEVTCGDLAGLPVASETMSLNGTLMHIAQISSIHLHWNHATRR